MRKILFIACKIGPHEIHRRFSEAINAKIVKCCVSLGKLATILNILESVIRSFLYDPNFIIVEGMESIYLAIFIKLRNKKIKVIYHDADPFFYRDYPQFSGIKKKFIDFFLKRIDYIISDSNISKKYITKYIHKPIKVVYPFVNIEKFPFNPNLESKNIIYIGRLADEKNLFRLLDAYKLVKEKIPKSKLYIVGDGPQRKELERYVKRRKIKEVYFTGWLKDFRKYLNDSILGYNVSKFDAFGCTGLEFALSGIIPLLGKRNGNAEVLNEKRIICNPDSSREIAKKMIDLINLNKKEKLSLLKRLREKALKYNKEKQCKTFKKVFKELVNEK